MAPRKAAKHTDTDVVDKAAEAGDVSPPKRKKTVRKFGNKSEEDKQIRLPRAAKSSKSEHMEVKEKSLTVTKNVKANHKPKSPIKTVSGQTKLNSRVKTAVKKNQELEEKSDKSPTSVDDIKNNNESETKRTRTKAATKKAGPDIDAELKGKLKGKNKKFMDNQNAENVDAPVVKKSKPSNSETTLKLVKPKGKITKKKGEINADTKSKGSNNKTKVAVSHDTESNDIEEESNVIAKIHKKGNNDKATKPVATRKTRDRKNEAGTLDKSKEDEELKPEKEESMDIAQFSDIENEEGSNILLETIESIQVQKRGKMVKKKEIAVTQKKVTKTRGKTTTRNAEISLNEVDAEIAKVGKDVHKKVNKETTVAAVPIKKGRTRKGAVTTIAVEENGEKVPENVTENEDVLHSSETLNSNYNEQKLSDEDNDKKQNLEKEDMKHTKSRPKKVENAVTIQSEVNENNIISTSEHEEN